jgi:hypothetical protein
MIHRLLPRIARSLWLIAALAVVGWGSSARADGVPIELAADDGASEALDLEAIRASLSTELETSVSVVTLEVLAAPDAVRLTIRLRGPRRAALELAASGRPALRRTTRLTADREDRTATIVILATNMVRDEAGEIVAMLRRRREPLVEPAPALEPAPAPALEPAPAPEPTPELPLPLAGEGRGEGATPSPSTELEAELEAEREAEPEAEPEVETETETETDVELELAPPPSDPFLRLGVDGQFSSVPRGGNVYDFAYIAGLQIAFTPLPFLAVGLRELGGALAVNDRWNAGGAIFGELAWRYADFGDLHGGLGVHVQYLGGAGIPDAFGVAPLLYVGARFYPLPIFSIALEGALRGVVTDSFHTGLSVVPNGALFLSGGLSIAFHISS